MPAKITAKEGRVDMLSDTQRYARDPTWWVYLFRLQDVKKQRERRKTKATKAERRKKK